MFLVDVMPTPSTSVSSMGPVTSASDVNKPIQLLMANVSDHTPAVSMRAEPMNVSIVDSEQHSMATNVKELSIVLISMVKNATSVKMGTH